MRDETWGFSSLSSRPISRDESWEWDCFSTLKGEKETRPSLALIYFVLKLFIGKKKKKSQMIVIDHLNFENVQVNYFLMTTMYNNS